jgi:hypothetical protein
MAWMGTTAKKPVELTDPEIEELRQSIKDNGLFGAVQQMTVEHRGLARRAIREALGLLLDHRKRVAEGVVQRNAALQRLTENGA